MKPGGKIKCPPPLTFRKQLMKPQLNDVSTMSLLRYLSYIFSVPQILLKTLGLLSKLKRSLSPIFQYY